jgi:hypothetical protein
VAWTEVIVFDPGNMRVLVVELFFVVEGAHEVLNVGDFGVALPDEHTDALLFIGEGSLLLMFGSCDMLWSNSMYFAWVMSVHGGVTVNADANAIACERGRGAEGIDSGI